METLKALLAVVLWAAPPSAAADPTVGPVGRWWRWKVFAGMLVLYVGVSFHIAWICNVFAPWHLTGAAMASDLVPMQQQLTAMQLDQVEAKLQREQIAICRFVEGGRGKSGNELAALQYALTAAQNSYQMDMRVYIKLHGTPMPEQPCSVILVAGGSGN